MASNFWKTVDLRKLEIPSDVISKRDSVSISEGFKDVADAKVFYREGLLDKQNSLSVSLLLLHGLRFTSKTWLDLSTIHTLAAVGYRVVAIDIPGYGNSPDTEISDRIIFLKHLLESFDFEKVVIVSPSMSGFFTLPFLLKYSEMLAGYVPVAPVGIRVLEEQPKIKDMNILNSIYEPLKKFLEQPLPDLSHITTPTMIVFGERDRSRSSALLSLLPQSQCQEIPNGGHPAYLKDPNLWHKLLYNFLHHLTNTV